MIRNNKNKMVKKRVPKKGTLQNRPLRMNRELIRSPVPDRTIVRLRSVLPTENIFNSATTVDGLAYYMNSIFESKSGTNFSAPYLGGYALLYRRYRVIRSSVLFTFANRETTKQVCLLVSPASGSSTATAPAAFSDLASLPFAKHINLGPISSGNNIGKIRINFFT